MAENKETQEEVVEAAAEQPEDQQDTRLEELNDQLMRTIAEFDNYKKRTAKEKDAIYLNASADTVAKFLPVLDNLERGLDAAQKAEDVKSVTDGIEMILKQFKETLAALDVEPIAAVGEEFNPELHNAVMHTEDEACAANTVVEEFQKGYKMKEKVLRHSMVKVCN